MSLLKPAANNTAYLKAGIYGSEGSGKTFTASRLAAGLAKLSNKENPKVAFFDTEKGSDYLVNYFKQQGIQFDVVKSRAFADLLTTIREVEQDKYDVLIVDSATHIWNELMESYKQKKHKTALSFADWAPLKGEWQKFSNAFINSKCHSIVLGRAGNMYEMELNEDTGKKEVIKTGTKMKAEGEFGYESDILMEMERIVENKKITNRCFVIKDRTNTMNGKMIDFPKFEDFKSVIDFLNLGGEHIGVDTKRNSKDLFDSPDNSHYEQKKQQEIAQEELKDFLVENDLAGTAVAVQKRRIELLKQTFGNSAWSYIQTLPASEIRDGITTLGTILATTNEIKDEDIV